MRNSFLLLVFALLAASCKKDADTPPHQNTFSATIHGSTFVPTTIEVTNYGSSSSGPGAVNVYAAEENGRVLTLYMYEYDGTKSTFNLINIDQNGGALASFGAFCANNCGSLLSDVSASNNGEINIASFDKTTYKEGEVITGTFQFEAGDSTGKISITNGHFSLLVPN